MKTRGKHILSLYFSLPRPSCYKIQSLLCKSICLCALYMLRHDLHKVIDIGEQHNADEDDKTDTESIFLELFG